MSKTRKTILAIIAVFVLILTAFQGLIPTITWVPQEQLTIYGSITFVVVNILTVWKQYLSASVATGPAIKRTLIVALIATVAGLLDVTNLVHFPGHWGDIIRFIFTLIAMVLNLLSKQMFPSEEQKAINEEKAANTRG